MACCAAGTAGRLPVHPPNAAHSSPLNLLQLQVSLTVAVAGAPIALDSCAAAVPSPDCKVQPWAGAPRPVDDSERLQALAEVADGIQGQSTAFLPDRYIELCRRVFNVRLRDGPHVLLCTWQAFSPVPGASDHTVVVCHMLQQP